MPMLSPMFEELSEDVFRRNYPFLSSNVGVVVGEDGVLLVDTRESHESAAELVDELRTLTPRPVRWVVNTHWHWDHVFGNYAFHRAAILGHHRCRRALEGSPAQHRQDARRWMPAERFEEIDRVVIVPPQQTFEALSSVDVGGRIVELSYHGRGHTDADILVHCGGVTFMGDLVEGGLPPQMGDSYPFDWPATLAAARRAIGQVVVPGHGRLLELAEVDDQRLRLERVARILREVLYEGRSTEEAIRNGPIPEIGMRKALRRARQARGS